MGVHEAGSTHGGSRMPRHPIRVAKTRRLSSGCRVGSATRDGVSRREEAHIIVVHQLLGAPLEASCGTKA